MPFLYLISQAASTLQGLPESSTGSFTRTSSPLLSCHAIPFHRRTVGGVELEKLPGKEALEKPGETQSGGVALAESSQCTICTQ